jgi:hypothetical protein
MSHSTFVLALTAPARLAKESQLDLVVELELDAGRTRIVEEKEKTDDRVHGLVMALFAEKRLSDLCRTLRLDLGYYAQV